MAESQAPYIYNGTEDNIIKDLSEARFEPYLKNAGFDRNYAFNLYLYNARLSKAFLYPLHILEVTLRNRVNEILSASFNDKWYQNKTFRLGLSPHSLDALDRGISRTKRPNIEDVIATLTFDFWSNLFRHQYDRFIWQTNMSKLLPNAKLTRKEFEKIIRKINDFRNRIAHYEPIHKINLSEMHVAIIDTLSWLSHDISCWVKHHSTVNECLRMKPSIKVGGYTIVGNRCDDDFQILSLNDSISKIKRSNFTLCVTPENQINAVINHEHLAKYLMLHIENEELLIDFNSHEISQLVTKLNLSHNMNLCDPHEQYKTIDKHFKGRTKFLVALDKKRVWGVIEKSHRRY